MARDVVEGASKARYVTKELLAAIKADAQERWGVGSCDNCIGGSIAYALGLDRDQMYPASRYNVFKYMLNRLYLKYQGICCHCGEWMPRDKASREHVLPVRDYPELAREMSNMKLAHKDRCNK